MRNLITAGLLALLSSCAFAPAFANEDGKPRFATECAYEAQEARVTDELKAEPDRPHFVIEGNDLARFIKNINELYNVGLVPAAVDRVYIVEQLMHPSNPNFQGVHMFLFRDGCLVHYQTTYLVVVKLLLSDDPEAILHGDRH